MAMTNWNSHLPLTNSNLDTKGELWEKPEPCPRGLYMQGKYSEMVKELLIHM